eukprot:g1826.t1
MMTPGGLPRGWPQALASPPRGALALVALPLLGAMSRESPLRRLLVQLVILALRVSTPMAVSVLLRNLWMNVSPHHFHPRVLVKYGLISWSLAETMFMIYIWQYTRFLNGQTTRRWRAVNVHNTAEKRRASMERRAEQYWHKASQING